MKAEERKELETNSLIRGITSLVERAKSGRLFSPWVLAVLVIVVVGGGIWFYLAYEGGKLTSAAWVAVSRSSSTADLKDVLDVHKDGPAARVARLELARIQLGPDGIGKLATRERDERNKAIENIEKAREELTKLADEFKGDKTMRATCLLGVAEAELALVGVPKDASGPESRGSVAKAVELYREAAKVVGEKSTAAETYRKRADDLEAKKSQIEDVGSRLYNLLAPPPSFTFPGAGGTGPKAPEGPIGTPKPPEGTGPKAPTTPVIPSGTGASEPPMPPKTPTTTIPTKKS
jgi:hypothetical protein